MNKQITMNIYTVTTKKGNLIGLTETLYGAKNLFIEYLDKSYTGHKRDETRANWHYYVRKLKVGKYYKKTSELTFINPDER